MIQSIPEQTRSPPLEAAERSTFIEQRRSPATRRGEDPDGIPHTSDDTPDMC